MMIVRQMLNFPKLINDLIEDQAIKAMAFPKSTQGSAKRVIYYIQPAEDKLDFIYETIKDHECNHKWAQTKKSEKKYRSKLCTLKRAKKIRAHFFVNWKRVFKSTESRECKILRKKCLLFLKKLYEVCPREYPHLSDIMTRGVLLCEVVSIVKSGLLD